jgi:hypothetical protein
MTSASSLPSEALSITTSISLTTLPCCTTNQDASSAGDPLNLVLIGNAEDLFPDFVRRGWHATEATYAGSIRKTLMSYLFRDRYIYSPSIPRSALCMRLGARRTSPSRNPAARFTSAITCVCG